MHFFKSHTAKTLVILTVLPITSSLFADTIEGRRSKLLEVLSSPELLKMNDFSGTTYSPRRQWQYYHACLARGIRLQEANEYFAHSNDIEADEWPVLTYLRTYLKFKDTLLKRPARTRFEGIFREYRQSHGRGKNPEQHGTKGNHSIVAFSTYLLIDQMLGGGDKRDVVTDKFITWVQVQGREARDEVHSPHYLERSLLPLMNLFDFHADPKIRRWAQMAIDQMMAEFALTSLKNVRGGPWCRAHQYHAPFVEEHNDGTHDSFYVMGYLFFGGSRRPAYVMTNQILSYGFITTTNYRPPAVLIDLASAAAKGSYEYRAHCIPVSSPQPEWDMYYYVTPSFCLSALQDRVELDNHQTNGRTRDYVNTQVWELTFSDPRKILGPKRDLRISTGDINNKVEINNINTVHMQYKNVLLFRGDFMDYNLNLHEGGAHHAENVIRNRKSYHFWAVNTTEGLIYVGITHFLDFSNGKNGILEVCPAHEFDSFEDFQKAIKHTSSKCEGKGNLISYVSTRGDTITYQNPTGRPGAGQAVVNGSEFSLHGYDLYDSPFMKSAHGSGLISVTFQNKSLLLDFRDRHHPLREESP